MGWFLSFISALLIMGNWYHTSNINQSISNSEEGQLQQQAYEILRLTNAINDWRYNHPTDLREGGTLTVRELGITPVYGTKHIILNQKTFVWLPFRPGLIAALRDVTGSSELIYYVKNRKLLDKNDNYIGSPPSAIPEGAVVIIN
ncbi:type IV pilus biogenesis protein PilM [Escherichia coli]|nr:type IV pilus biogenesis protein PilM [Escherichia coli]